MLVTTATDPQREIFVETLKDCCSLIVDCVYSGHRRQKVLCIGCVSSKSSIAMSSRTTRSRSKVEALTPLTRPNDFPITLENKATPVFQIPENILSQFSEPIISLPSNLTRKLTRLNQKSHVLLLQKQRLLEALNLPVTHTDGEYFVNKLASSRSRGKDSVQPSENAIVTNAVLSTLIFAGDCAGTAVCIHASGLVLTCAHCIAESREELERNHGRGKLELLCLLTAEGHVVLARYIAWDERRDLALLRIVSAQVNSRAIDDRSIDHVCEIPCTSLQMCQSRPALKSEVICIGQPGAEDLEAAVEGVEAGYPILAISRGRFLGYAKGQDIEDNSEIGALCHDAWTYWGHSGAPLVDLRGDGHLVGLHSSWDDQTGTRRGVGIEAIRGFLTEISEVLSSGKSSDTFVSTL